MKPYYEDSSVTIYHGDCRDIFRGLPTVDLVLTDPPYGIGWNPRINHKDSPWRDNERPLIKQFLTGRYHCIWGGNYFSDQLTVSESWFIWIKRPDGFNFDNDGRSYSTCEMCWSDFGGKPRIRHQCWDGGMRAGDESNRHFNHPAQKPVEVMAWCIGACPNDPRTVLDPFMGSGTTLRAAKDLGRKAIGIEIEERYCEIAARRMEQEVFTFGDACSNWKYPKQEELFA
jgi:DNA modification methylase